MLRSVQVTGIEYNCSGVLVSTRDGQLFKVRSCLCEPGRGITLLNENHTASSLAS